MCTRSLTSSALRQAVRTAIVALSSLLLAAPVETRAATISLHQDAVTAAVAQRLFTTDGKRVLSGNAAGCTYVYLEEPGVVFRDGRMFLRVHVAGRAGVKVGGSCVGAGDAFYATVSGQPFVDGERMGLTALRLDEGKPGYRKLLERLLQNQVPALLGLNPREEVNKLFRNHASGFNIVLAQFQLVEVRAADALLTVQFDFMLRADPN